MVDLVQLEARGIVDLTAVLAVLVGQGVPDLVVLTDLVILLVDLSLAVLVPSVTVVDREVDLAVPLVIAVDQEVDLAVPLVTVANQGVDLVTVIDLEVDLAVPLGNVVDLEVDLVGPVKTVPGTLADLSVVQVVSGILGFQIDLISGVLTSAALSDPV